MKWVLVKHPYAAVQKFQLEERNSIKAVLKFNLAQQSTRISNNNSQQLFFLERSGLWNNRIFFKSGYGVELGKLTFEKGLHSGTVELEYKKFHFSIKDNPVTELAIYELGHTEPLVVCPVESDGENLYDIVPEERDIEQEYASLLLGLCWFLFPEAAPEEKEEYVPIISNQS